MVRDGPDADYRRHRYAKRKQTTILWLIVTPTMKWHKTEVSNGRKCYEVIVFSGWRFELSLLPPKAAGSRADRPLLNVADRQAIDSSRATPSLTVIR